MGRRLSTAGRFLADHRVQDAILAQVLAVIGLLLMSVPAPAGQWRAIDPFGAALMLAATLPIALRHQRPMPVLLVVGAAEITLGALGYAGDGGIPVLFALHTVAANTDRQTSFRALGLVAAGLVAALVLEGGGIEARLGNLAVQSLVFGAVWVFGDTLRSRRERVTHLEERAALLEERAVLLERERAESARLAVAEERTRIARELHDVVAHHVSVMVVQSGAARRVLDGRPDAAREALEAVEETGRQALTEMRRVVGVLRATDGPQAREPLPSLDRLDELLGQVRDAGLPVELVVEGAPRSLPAGVDLSAYRIVQEALTNALKHAGRATSRVQLRYGRDMLEIEVSDDGRGAAPARAAGTDGRDDIGGHGLVGMRERAALFGGRLEAGPRPTGGYVVSASLPIEGGEARLAR